MKKFVDETPGSKIFTGNFHIWSYKKSMKLKFVKNKKKHWLSFQ